ncbi:MAG TPA: amidohydrolase family protein [Steroidobacteraceae bacterium]|nr:amidohydrolase family protein [Steroidobacteraceae bacterium]
MKVLFKGARLFDGWSSTLREGCEVLVEAGEIRRISDQPLPREPGIEVVECAGRVLMPGLIDAHVHVYCSTFDLPTTRPGTYLAHYAAQFLTHSLDRGFTTVRDTGGADVGLATALRDGLLTGPRLFYGGRIITQTGGGNDQRSLEHSLPDHSCGCAGYHDPFTVVADGQEAILRAVREELRRGASHIKIMLSGSVVSPHASVNRSEYSDPEVITIVEEANRAGKYVTAHCHTAQAMRRGVSLGVRCIEHGTQVDAETAAYVAERGAYVVPTLAIMFGMLDEHESLKLPQVYMEKLQRICERVLPGLEIMKAAGVKMGFGSDLLGPLHTRQTTEFSLRARVLPAIDILRSACAVNAEILGEPERLGCIREGAFADLLVVDGDPLSDISVLTGNGERLAVIMHGGRFHKRTI